MGNLGISPEEIEQARLHVVQQATLLDWPFEVHRFGSEAYMIDIDLPNDTLVVQLTDHYLGVSLVGDNLSFTTLPDFPYYVLTEFQSAFDKMISNG